MNGISSGSYSPPSASASLSRSRTNHAAGNTTSSPQSALVIAAATFRAAPAPRSRTGAPIGPSGGLNSRATVVCMIARSLTICDDGEFGSAARSFERRSAGSAPETTFHSASTAPEGATTTRSTTTRMGHSCAHTSSIAALSVRSSVGVAVTGSWWCDAWYTEKWYTAGSWYHTESP